MRTLVRNDWEVELVLEGIACCPRVGDPVNISNTLHDRETEDTGQPLVSFEWSIGHTLRPNGEVLEGNPPQPDVYIPITRDNFRWYHPMFLNRAVAALDSANPDTRLTSVRRSRRTCGISEMARWCG